MPNNKDPEILMAALIDLYRIFEDEITQEHDMAVPHGDSPEEIEGCPVCRARALMESV